MRKLRQYERVQLGRVGSASFGKGMASAMPQQQRTSTALAAEVNNSQEQNRRWSREEGTANAVPVSFCEERTRNFEFYEFAAVLTPGVITLVGLLWLFPISPQGTHPFELSAGAFGVGLILAYAVGHLVQLVGNIIEGSYWRLLGGRPTDWVTACRNGLISSAQRLALQNRVQRDIAGFNDQTLAHCKKAEWLFATRQIYATVNKAGSAARVDIFNANYGLCRGMASAFLVLLASSIYLSRLGGLRRDAFLIALFAVALYRMHRFAVYYARELFVQFIQLRPVAEKERMAGSSAAKELPNHV
jgi:hypothetical protein